MSPRSKAAYLGAIVKRYGASSRSEKQSILDEFCHVCHYNRKYAIRLLNANQASKNHKKKQGKRGRPAKYDHPMIIQVLRDLWVATNLACSKRLKAIIPLWLPYYQDYDVPEEIKQLLLSISPATIDRIMAPSRKKFQTRGRATTKPGSLLKKKIAIKTQQWDETVPGFIEVDTVAHCGSSTKGMFVFTVNCVDIVSEWTEQRAIWGKGEINTCNAVESIENALPFPLRGFDCDNGSEFLNWHLYRYMTQERKKAVQFTRSRPYRKNDNAHVENKNWTHVRQFIGYQRFDQPELAEALNQIYTSEWRLYLNFFIPSVKLIAKERVGSRIIKIHDEPKTPVQRLLDSEHIPESKKQLLKEQLQSLNPFELQRQISKKIKAFFRLVDKLNHKGD